MKIYRPKISKIEFEKTYYSNLISYKQFKNIIDTISYDMLITINDSKEFCADTCSITYLLENKLCVYISDPWDGLRYSGSFEKPGYYISVLGMYIYDLFESYTYNMIFNSTEFLKEHTNYRLNTNSIAIYTKDELVSIYYDYAKNSISSYFPKNIFFESDKNFEEMMNDISSGIKELKTIEKLLPELKANIENLNLCEFYDALKLNSRNEKLEKIE